MKSPDYGFEEGLILERVAHLTPDTYGHDGLGDKVEIATVDDVRRLSTEPYTADRIASVVGQLERTRCIRSLGGVGLEAAVVNAGVDSGRVAFHFYGWGGNFRHPNAQREAIALQYRQPDVAHVFMNGPGIGNSGMLPPEVRREIRRTGSYLPLGEYLGPVAEHIAQDYDRVVMGGHSLGARMATAAAAHMDPELIDELRLHDPVGTDDMGLLGIARNFILREGVDDARYTKASVAPSAKEIGLRMLSVKAPEAEGIETALPDDAGREFVPPKHGWMQQLLVDPYALGRDAFEGDLLVAAPNIDEAINIIVPNMSRLNDWRAIQGIVGRMRLLGVMSAEVSQWNLLGHTHANMNQPASLAAIYGADL